MKNGKPLNRIQTLTGHANLRMTEHYDFNENVQKTQDLFETNYDSLDSGENTNCYIERNTEDQNSHKNNFFLSNNSSGGGGIRGDEIKELSKTFDIMKIPELKLDKNNVHNCELSLFSESLEKLLELCE